jgi:hypothetical protein
MLFFYYSDVRNVLYSTGNVEPGMEQYERLSDICVYFFTALPLVSKNTIMITPYVLGL